MSQQVKKRGIESSKEEGGFQAYDAYDETGVQWLGEIPSHWDTTKIGFHTNLENGYAFSSKHFSKDTGLPLVRIRDLGADETEAYYDAPPPTSFRVENGDIVIGMDGDFEVDRWSGEPALLNQRLCCLKPREKVDSRFLFYSLPLPLDIINDLTHSTTVKHLSSKQVRNISIAFPPYSEQRAIGRFLDNNTAQIDRLIDKKERLIELLEERRTALITKAVTKGLDPDVPMKDSGVEWLGEIPERWEVAPLSAAAEGCYNGIWGDDPDGEHDVACLRVEDFDRFRATVRTQEPTIRSVQPRYRTQRQLQVGDLLLEKSGGGDKQPVGFAVLVTGLDRPSVCSNFAARMPVRDGVSPSFLRFVLYHLYHTGVNTRSIKQTTGIQNLDADHYLSTPFALPPESAQREIAEYLEDQTTETESLISRVHDAIDRLQEYRSALITAAVTGKIDVRERAA